jgi:hypothetical protein
MNGRLGICGMCGLALACASQAITPTGGGPGGQASAAGGTETATSGRGGDGLVAGSGGGSGGAATFGGSGGGGLAGGGTRLGDVQPIFDAHCVNCHDKAKTGLPTFGKLSLLAGDARGALVGEPASEVCGGTLVAPGEPDRSYLWHKLTDTKPCEGQPMPRPFEIVRPAPLSADELATLRAWIAAGAPE